MEFIEFKLGRTGILKTLILFLTLSLSMENCTIYLIQLEFYSLSHLGLIYINFLFKFFILRSTYTDGIWLLLSLSPCLFKYTNLVSYDALISYFILLYSACYQLF